MISFRFWEKAKARRAQIGRKGLRRKPPRWQYPASIEREYTRTILDMLKQLENSVMRQIISRVPEWSLENEMLMQSRADDWIDDLEALMAALRLDANRIFSDPDKIASLYAELTVAYNHKQFVKLVNSIFGVDPLVSEPWLRPQIKAFVAENTSLIKSIPQRFLDDVEGVIQRGIASGTPTREITKQLAKRFHVAESRAALIATDQIGKFNGNLTEARQTEIGVSRYIWRTSRDGRVREEHAAREGKIFSWNKPPYDGHPGEPIRCRCYAEPILDDLINGTE